MRINDNRLINIRIYRIPIIIIYFNEFQFGGIPSNGKLQASNRIVKAIGLDMVGNFGATIIWSAVRRIDCQCYLRLKATKNSQRNNKRQINA